MQKAKHLNFTEDELADPAVRKAAVKAEKAANKADHATDKLPKKRKLRLDTDPATGRKTKLTFSKEEIPAEQLTGRGSRLARRAKHSSQAALSGSIHNQIAKNNEDDNVAVQAVDTTIGAVETGAHTIDHAVYSKKLKAYEQAQKLMTQSDAANVEATYRQHAQAHPEDFSNPLSRLQQKKVIQQEYAAARRMEQAAASTGNAANTAGQGTGGLKSIGQKLSDLKDKAVRYVTEHPHMLLLIATLAMLFLVVASSFSSCSTLLQGSSGVVLTTTFTADDEEIIGANNDYKALEAALQQQIDRIETTHPGYDEYRYNLTEIGHDPYQLAAYLTVLFEDYTRSQVQATLRTLFELQYQLTLEETVETRTRTETRTGYLSSTDSVTNEVTVEEYEYEEEVEYDYHILTITLTNQNLGHVITESGGMTEDQAERYAILLETKGNKADLFADDPYIAASSDYLDYDIPGEALTDEKFANMIREAEKYLGYPYVWGGSSPSTSFDCSGFVSYVINNCGNGWNVGRLTANGLKNYCQIIPASEARPGDLIFFQGTYNTSGASHVGIYVGNGMMIHCGNPISYTSIETSYWQQHFYCYGRLPD